MEERSQTQTTADQGPLRDSLQRGSELLEQMNNPRPWQPLQLRIKRLRPDAVLPTKSYEGDAGFDLYCIEDIFIHSGAKIHVETGLAFEIPEGWFLHTHLRGSIGTQTYLRIHHSIIDAGFRGAYSFTLFNTHQKDPYQFLKGERLVQIVMLPVPNVEIVEVDELGESERGHGKWGSSGR